MTKEIWALSGSVLLAIVGYLFTYFHHRLRDRRSSRLDRVNSQLRNLYGPLYAALHANNATWDSFSDNYWPAHDGESYFEVGKPLSNDEREQWMRWMKEVFAPQNEKIAELIVENGDLIEGKEFPEAFVQALAHIAAYRAVIQAWDEGRYDEYTSVIDFPRSELLEAVEPVYHRLREEQAKLIGQVQDLHNQPIQPTR